MTQVRPFKLNCYNQYQRSKATKTSVPLVSMSENTQSIQIQRINCISLFPLHVTYQSSFPWGWGYPHSLFQLRQRVF